MSDRDQYPLDNFEKPDDQPWTIPDDADKGVYRFILAAARRARQLQSGARPLITTTSRKPTKIAMEEVRAGAVGVEIIPEDQPWPPEPAHIQDSPGDEERFPTDFRVPSDFLPPR